MRTNKRAVGSGSLILAMILACAWQLLSGRAAADEAIPRPPELERDVQFWIRVYTQVTTNEGFLHDEHNLGVVYQTVHFDPGAEQGQRRAELDALRDRYRGMLRRLADGASDLTEEEEQIRAMFGSEASPARFEQARNEVRFQLGQADRFREGIVRSGTWEAHIADTLANLGLPPEISALPHVESSFNPEAYSKVGAAGLWQFMRSTGRRFLRIDDAVDERMDPFRATEAAAQLLDFNYRLLGSWPLALTAYNHGAAGMRRARDAMGTSDIVPIVRQHKSPTFGFASRNFYVSFLAALEIDRNPEKYFGAIERRPESRFKEVEVPAFVPMSALERVVKVDRARLQTLNPALRPPVWAGSRLVPQGYRLRLPGEAADWSTEQLAARLAPGEKFAGQPRPRSYRVRPGDTLASVAREQGVELEELAQLNGLQQNARLKNGRSLKLPAAGPITARASESAAPAVSTLEKIYVVHAGDALSDIATRVGVPVAQLITLNQLRNPDSLYEGQRLHLAADAAHDNAEPVSQALSEQRAETRVATSAEQKPAPRSEPVSAAQAEAQSPGPGARQLGRAGQRPGGLQRRQRRHHQGCRGRDSGPLRRLARNQRRAPAQAQRNCSLAPGGHGSQGQTGLLQDCENELRAEAARISPAAAGGLLCQPSHRWHGSLRRASGGFALGGHAALRQAARLAAAAIQP